MRGAPVGNIVRTVNAVSPEDSIGRAAEVMRVFGLAELPVVNMGRVVGRASEAAVLDVITSADPVAMAERPVSTVMSDHVVCVNRFMTVGQVAEVLKDEGLQVVPVVNEFGAYLGVVTRSDITSALCLTIRPPVVAGLATPLGVYLTTGHLRAGAGNLGLFLAGVAMMLLYHAAFGVIFGIAWLVQETTPLYLWAILNSSPIMTPNWMDTVRSIMLGAAVPVFFVLLRLMPLAGYHAAEHQVVHAIERGESLKPEIVQAMPRVHPRCGTNIVAAILLFVMVAQVFSNETAVLVALFVLVFAWRVVGGYFQYYVTTRPASRKQIENGIEVGRALLEKYRENPTYQVTGWQRIVNTGLPLVMMGAAATTAVWEALGGVLRGIF